MIAAFIVGCEIAFWLFVLGGLVCRYVLKQKALGAILLYCTPLVDLALIVATIVDLNAGATATLAHSLSAIYIGVSIACGHRMIQWADAQFAYRYAGGPKPEPKPKYGKAHARHERQGWLMHLFAWAIGCAVLYGMIWFVGDAGRTEQLAGTLRLWSIILAIDFAISFSYTLWPKQDKSGVKSA